ncbi:STAS domain-containing protein [Roseibium sp.]|uniref:STAS domain-containing protein n=1 Tax=Roseibium sp. TaxID=1936156 RepID=UPI003A98547B
MNTDNIADEGSVFSLPEQCDLAAAALVHSTLVELLSGPVLEIDAGRVERCSTSVAQILLAASKEVDDQGGKMNVRNMTPAFLKCFEDLGLAQNVTIWE